MKVKISKAAQEPIGIVIAGLPRPQETTVFSAYVWGPAPAPSADSEPTAD